jgi:hypothetical protein
MLENLQRSDIWPVATSSKLSTFRFVATAGNQPSVGTLATALNTSNSSMTTAELLATERI